MNPCHHHASCQSHALEQAEQRCRNLGAKLTPLRRRVLELIWSNHQAVKAYELIDLLSTEDHSVKPPTVYRSLDFLLEHGLIHRIDSLNAFVGCSHPHEPHDVRLLICTQCQQVSELSDPNLDQALTQALAAHGFRPSRAHLEIHGLCAHCQENLTHEH